MPSETHRHYDADGNLTGFTVVERESRVDDADRIEMLALARYEAEVCDCGYHSSLTEDEANTFTPETHTCRVCGGQAVWNRILADQDQSVPHDAPAKTPRPSDGRKSYMRMLTPEQVAARTS